MLDRTHDEDGSHETLRLPEAETRNALLGNLFISDGKAGPVLKVYCKGRTGKEDSLQIITKCFLF
jgi:hypothetical protein